MKRILLALAVVAGFLLGSLGLGTAKAEVYISALNCPATSGYSARVCFDPIAGIGPHVRIYWADGTVIQYPASTQDCGSWTAAKAYGSGDFIRFNDFGNGQYQSLANGSLNPNKLIFISSGAYTPGFCNVYISSAGSASVYFVAGLAGYEFVTTT